MEGGGPSLSEEESTLAFPERDLWAVFVLVYVGLKFDSLCLLLDPIPHSSISQEIERLCCPETSHRTVEEFCRGVSPGKVRWTPVAPLALLQCDINIRFFPRRAV